MKFRRGDAVVSVSGHREFTVQTAPDGYTGVVVATSGYDVLVKWDKPICISATTTHRGWWVHKRSIKMLDECECREATQAEIDNLLDGM